MTSAAPSAPEIDLAAALAMMNGEPRYVARMVRAALLTIPPGVIEAKDALEKQDWAQLEANAHRLKGALAALVARSAATAASELETAARGAQTEAAMTALARLETTTRAMLPALEEALLPGGIAWVGDPPV